MKLDQNPLISVIIPTFNAGRFLPDAIASIRQQSYEPLEIHLVDDGSTDETKSLAQQWPEVRYLHQPNQGAAAARNTGIRAARGSLLAFLDADDLWTPDHLRILLPHLLSEPSLQFVWGTTRFIRMSEEQRQKSVQLPRQCAESCEPVWDRLGGFSKVGIRRGWTVQCRAADRRGYRLAGTVPLCARSSKTHSRNRDDLSHPEGQPDGGRPNHECHGRCAAVDPPWTSGQSTNIHISAINRDSTLSAAESERLTDRLS